MNQPLYAPTYRLLIIKAVYICKKCGEKQTVPQEGKKLKAPTGCTHCDGKEFELLMEESEFVPVGIIGWHRVK